MRLRNVVLKRSEDGLWLHHLRSSYAAQLNDAALRAMIEALSGHGGAGAAMVDRLRRHSLVDDAPFEPVPERNASALITLELEPIGRCNLACQWCTWSRSGVLMNDVLFRRAVEGADLLGAVELVFKGGEPLLNRRTPDWIELATARRFRTRLFTNATLVSGRTARRLVEAGVSQVTVLLEGFEAVHDARFGPGVFRRAEQGVRNLVEEGLAVEVLTPSGDEAFHRHCRDRLGVARTQKAGEASEVTFGGTRLRVTARGEVHGPERLGSLAREPLTLIYATMDRRGRRAQGAAQA